MKRRAAAKLNGSTLAVDAPQTDICAYLQAILLVGLGFDAMLDYLISPKKTLKHCAYKSSVLKRPIK